MNEIGIFVPLAGLVFGAALYLALRGVKHPKQGGVKKHGKPA